ncbi:MAG: TatD family hydrolase [Bdellovibrionales bacterium]|nr:TatD family hydrolase [Bdellovibrionales bacterium]
MSWIDMHCHIPMLEIDLATTLEKTKSAGVERLIAIGMIPQDNDQVLKLAEDHFPTIACTLGVHPHDAKHFGPDSIAYLRKNVSKPCVVGIGEIGLDFYYNNSEREKQIEAFREQLKLADELKMPVQIHTRDAEDETIEILKELGGRVRGTIHCFTGTQKLADACIRLGLNISFSGIVTFKNAEDLRNVARSVPIDRMHVETDAPFLTPAPFRGKKNDPSYVHVTGEFVAQLKGLPLQEFKAQMKANALNTFPKLIWN